MSKIKVLNKGLGCREYTAGESITAGDLLVYDGSNGKVDVAATNERYLGIAQNDAAADETVSVELISTSTLLEVPVESGTASATSVGKQADVNSGDGATLTVTNGDFDIHKFVDAATVQATVVRSVNG